jgi:hypothetical protein
MSTTNAFAYNTGSPIDGTTQVGDLSVGTPTSGFTSSPQFWNGPDQDLGYVIARPVSGNTQPSPVIISAPTKLLTLSNVYIGWDISLSNGGQTASQIFGYQQTVLGNAQIDPNSKVMFSVLFNTSTPSTLPGSHVIGIGKTSMKYKGTNGLDSAYPGIDDVSMGYCADGSILYDGTLYFAGLSTWTDNDVIDVVINNEVNGMWVRVNGGYWNNNDGADPASNTFGIEIINGPFYPALCPAYEGVMTIQNSAEYGVPTGYTLLGSNETASVGFWGTKNMTNPLSDATFIQLSEYVANKNGTPQTFTAATDASSWLTANGYWNSYGLGFTLSQSDFVNANWGTYISPLANQNDGFTTTGQSGPGEAFYGPNLSVGYGGNLTKLNEIRSYWSSNGLNTNSNAYMFNVTWGTGSTISSGVVIMKFYDYGDTNAGLNLGVVDTSNPIWQTPGTGYYSGPILTLAGTWKFPSTFTLIQPPIEDGNNWC